MEFTTTTPDATKQEEVSTKTDTQQDIPSDSSATLENALSDFNDTIRESSDGSEDGDAGGYYESDSSEEDDDNCGSVYRPNKQDAEVTARLGPAAPRFYKWEELFGFLKLFKDNHEVLVKEMQSYSRAWTDWPETNLYSRKDEAGGWKVVPFLHTFPVLDESRITWVEPNMGKCPETVKLLQQVPGIRTALYSRLGPSTKLAYHQGWADLANHVLRIHYVLKCPSTPNVCGLEVEGQQQFHKEGEFIVFDDSKLHRAFNDSPDEDRVVLIFDILRPEGLPVGRATGEHTDELDKFLTEYIKSIGLEPDQ